MRFLDAYDLGKTYHAPDLIVLDNVNLRIPQGERVAIMGESGCGKSTLLKLLGGLLQPSRGTLRYANEEIAFTRHRGDIGYVFQDAVLLPWRTVRENARLPHESHPERTSV